MAQQYSLANSTNSSDRLLNVGKALVHLSDGTAVFLYYDGTNVVLAYTSDHATASTIVTLSGFGLPGVPNGLHVLRNSTDDLVVVGYDSTSTSKLRAQGFTKGVGYTWTTQTALVGASTLTATPAVSGAMWCNTGGGTGSKGHVFVAGCGSASQVTFYGILDMGAILAGTGTLVINEGTSPTFLANAVVNPGSNANIDLAPDGFGASNGLAICQQSAGGTLGVGAWAVDSSGALSTNTSITGASPLTVGTMAGASTKIRVLRHASNAWTLITPSTTAGRFMAARFSASAQLTAPTDWGTPTNGAANSAGLGWDAFVDPGVANKVWVIGSAAVSGGNQQMYRVGCSVASAVTWDGAATADDLLTTVNISGNNVRAVKHPTGTNVDWQVFVKATSTNWALYGDNTNLYFAPSTPGSWTNPTAGQIVRRNTVITLGWGASTAGAIASTYTIELSDTAGSFSSPTTIATGVSTNSYAWTPALTITPSTGYELRVKAVDVVSSTAYSTSSVFTIPVDDMQMLL